MTHAMRPIRETIPLDEALALILEHAAPVTRTERIPLAQAAGRVIASAPMASMVGPPCDRAATDGYAGRAAETFGAGRDEPRELRCGDKLYTGQVPSRGIARAE